MRIGVQVGLEPVARVEIEMIGRFVEEQERRASEQQLGERDAHLPAAGECLAWLREVALREPEALEHLRHPQVDAVPLFAAEELREVVVADEERFVLAIGQRRIGQRVFDAIDFGAGVEERLKRGRRFVDERAAGMVEAILREIPDGRRGRLDDQALVGVVEPGQDAQERGLAGSVRSAQADAVAVADLPGDVFEQHAFAEGLRRGLESWITGRSRSRARRRAPVPSRPGRAAAAMMCAVRNGLVR